MGYVLYSVAMRQQSDAHQLIVDGGCETGGRRGAEIAGMKVVL